MSKAKNTPVESVENQALTANNNSPESGFGERLSTLREKRRLKHDSLSELTKAIDPEKKGIARTTLRGYEHQVYKPGIRELRILSQALDVSIDELVYGDTPRASGKVSFEPGRPSDVLGMPPHRITDWVTFVAAMLNLDEADQKAVFALAHRLAEARMGAVEYAKLMGVTTETTETMFDAWKDSGGKFDPELTEKMRPVLEGVLKKYGIEIPVPATKQQ